MPSALRVADSGFGIRDSGFGIRDSGFGIRDSGFGIRDSRMLLAARDKNYPPAACMESLRH
ncbi:hypothetical protein Xcc1_30290 [Xanthomonas campestris pv. campestris]|nr:hypothetical protein Xcc1_30290 [Xanthomonas campestris pv. campestris]